ncbi:MAG: hypothetical protein Q8P52_00470 [bacterium]|nr:hypothetical protein [bacterium]
MFLFKMKMFRLFLTLSVLSVFAIPSPAFGVLPLTMYSCRIGLCIGGMVNTLVYCDEGVWVNGQFMYVYGTIPYLYYGIFHPGQNVVGTAGGFLTCTVGIYTIGGGLMVLPVTGTSG